MATSVIPGRVSRVANPGAAATLNFGSTLFILSFYNLRTRGITHSNVVLGMALFSGGLTQYMAGMWEFPRGNVFGATAFSLYGAFWMSYATIYIPSSGILAAYSTPEDFANAFGLYLITWFVITLFFLVAVVKRNNALTVFFSGLAITLLLLAVAQFNAAHITALTKASGVLGILTSLSAWYTSLAQILIPEQQPIFSLPLGIWRPRHRRAD